MLAAVRTEVDVANLALGHAQEPAIASLTAATAPARAANKWFAHARDETLAAAHWTFAKAWVQPAMDVAPSLGPLKNRFPLPPDCIAVRSVEGVTREEWDIEAGTADSAGAAVEAIVLVTDLAAPLVCYTRRIVTVALWSPAFVGAVALRLGARIANELARSPNLAAALLVDFSRALHDAERQDGRQRRAEAISRETPWVRARRGVR